MHWLAVGYGVLCDAKSTILFRSTCVLNVETVASLFHWWHRGFWFARNLRCSGWLTTKKLMLLVSPARFMKSHQKEMSLLEKSYTQSYEDANNVSNSPRSAWCHLGFSNAMALTSPKSYAVTSVGWRITFHSLRLHPITKEILEAVFGGVVVIFFQTLHLIFCLVSQLGLSLNSSCYFKTKMAVKLGV